MPIYMDRHQGEHLTAQAVAEAHAADIEVQKKYSCKFITYWFDEERDSVFCLVDAPNISAVRKRMMRRMGSGTMKSWRSTQTSFELFWVE